MTRLREQNENQPLIVLISGYSDLGVCEAYHKGAAGLWKKPYDPAEVVHKLNQILRPLSEPEEGEFVTIAHELNIPKS